MTEYSDKTKDSKLVVTDVQTKKILHERAVNLAQELETAKDAKGITVLEFILSGESYCIETTEIKEVYPLKEYTQIPCTPSFIFGVINFHGQILSIIDLKRVLNISDAGISDQNKIIVLEAQDMTIGIITDDILGIRDIEGNSIQRDMPSSLGDENSNYISGITTDGRIILDLKALLSDPAIIVNETVE
jgi:purine-binding chemotaxis protein CheW